MLTIRAAQVRAFDAAVVGQFAERVADDLLLSSVEGVRGLTRVELVERCRVAVTAGRASGLSDQADLHGFVWLTFVLGPGFHHYESIKAILRGTTVAEGRKMRVVAEMILAKRSGNRCRRQRIGRSE